MNIDWKRAGAAGSIIGGIAVIHGLRTRRWRYIHNFGVVLVIAAAAAARLKGKYAGAARAAETNECGPLHRAAGRWLAVAVAMVASALALDDEWTG
jgi:hypothetical protein